MDRARASDREERRSEGGLGIVRWSWEPGQVRWERRGEGRSRKGGRGTSR